MPAVSAETDVRPVPSLAGADHTLAFLRDPYRFIARACDACGSDVVLVRLMLKPTLCLRGAEAARLFYDKELFTRIDAAPEAAQATLSGKGGVQGLDGAAHLARKKFFLQATSPARVTSLAHAVEHCWNAMAGAWEAQAQFVLYDAMQRLLMRAVCLWAGVPLPPEQELARLRDVAALFDRAAAGVLPHLRARRARHRCEAWLAGCIEQSRRGSAVFPPGSIAHEAARLQDAGGARLPPRVAAVELLSVLRPTVAVAVSIVQAAHALHFHPQWRDALARGDAAVTRAFAQEVRRYYPFFPTIAARTRHEFTWQGYRFAAGVRAMLDLYGTNHDGRVWVQPHEFNPVRFLGVEPGLFNFVPQGGARAADHHRCPGEGITLALLERVLRLLASSQCVLPRQDLTMRMELMPALPASRMLLRAFEAARTQPPRVSAEEAYEFAAPGDRVLGWLVDRQQREQLLARFAPRYPRIVADHVTLRPHVHSCSLLPREGECEVVGSSDDGHGVQALVVRVGGTTARPDGSSYHITWSLAEGRQAVESNDVVAAFGWQPMQPLAVRLVPALFP